MNQELKQPTEFEMKMIRLQIEAQKREEEQKIKRIFKWETKAETIIKDQIAARKSKGLKNDWKVAFLESKLEAKKSIIKKLTSLIR